jgi:hypothetical protein
MAERRVPVTSDERFIMLKLRAAEARDAESATGA